MTTAPRVTVCVLTYGEHADLARRCISSILANCDRSLYELRIGCNECGAETLEYVRSVGADLVIESKRNINKCPMMRKLFADIETEFIWWFDDDSYVTTKDALERRMHIATHDRPGVCMWGHVFYFGKDSDFNYGVDIRAWLKAQSWHTGKESPCGVGKHIPGWNQGNENRWFFPTGGNWLIRSDVIRQLGWPTRSLVKRNDDVVLAEAIRQIGLEFVDIGALGVVINAALRRGSGEDAATTKKQFA